MDQREQDPADNAVRRPEVISYEELLAAAEQIGANKGDRRVIDLYRTWIALQGAGGRQSHAAWFNLGTEWNHAGEYDNAILAYRAALASRPDFAPAAINLGLLLERRGEPQMALACWTETLQKDDARTSLLNQRARLLEQLGQLAGAEEAMRASLTILHDQPDVIQNWLHIRQRMCQWPVLSDAIRGLSPADLMASCDPLAALALTDRAAVQARIAGAWIERKMPPAPEHLAPREGYGHDRIRMGYLSSDLGSHAMSYLIAELFERHDRSRFEIHGYCAGPRNGSDILRRMIAASDHFTAIEDMTDETAARTIRADEIDILIDLDGLTTGTRMAILRWRPAPVQATYLGFIGAVPMPELDFLLRDKSLIPAVYAALYEPQRPYAAQLCPANDSNPATGEPVSRSAAGLPEDRFVFCCFADHSKITEAMFDAWMEILRCTGNSVLWLVSDNTWSRDNLRQRAMTADVDPARILFAGPAGPDECMARLALADLFLDTSPSNAGAIAGDAIRMGLPMVTLCGESFASRMTGGMLQAIGATPGITETIERYVETSVTLANQPALLAQYRSLFTESRPAITVGDIASFTFHYEESLIQIELALHTRNTREPEPPGEAASRQFLAAAAAD